MSTFHSTMLPLNPANPLIRFTFAKLPGAAASDGVWLPAGLKRSCSADKRGSACSKRRVLSPSWWKFSALAERGKIRFCRNLCEHGAAGCCDTRVTHPRDTAAGDRMVLTRGMSRAVADGPGRYWAARLMGLSLADCATALFLCWTNSHMQSAPSEASPFPHGGRDCHGDQDAPRTPSVPSTQEGE